MKKERLKEKIYLWCGSLVFCLVVYSCLHDDWKFDQNGKVVSGKNKELTIATARAWYEANNKPVAVTRSAVTDFEILTKPRWNKARESRLDNFEVVELPLMTRGGAVILDADTRDRYDPEVDGNKIHNVFRAVIIKNLNTGEMTHFMMIFVGTYDYLMKTKTFHKNSYFHREADFSGCLYFYKQEEGLVNGWKYKDGKIIGKISQGTREGFRLAATRSYQCDVEWTLVEYDECEGFVYSDPEYGTGFGSECTTTSDWEYQLVCTEVEEEEENTSGGGSWFPPGNGGYTPPAIAPKAKAIFRNSNMTDANWAILEKMISKIMENCMGQSLYEELSKKLGGKTMSIEFNGGEESSFSFDGSTAGISLDATGESSRLFHELWHAHQAYGETSSSFQTSLLNQEIETRYAQYLYLRKLPEYSGSKWEKEHTDNVILRSITNLRDYVDEKGYLMPGVTNEMLDLNVILSMQAFKSSSAYSNYKYDDDRMGLRNFTNLRKLTINC